MNIAPRTRRSSVASTLAVAALAISACGAEEIPARASESEPGRDITLTVAPDGPVTFDASGTARYTVGWVAQPAPDDTDDDTCTLVLRVIDPTDRVINSVPVTGCKSSMDMMLSDADGTALPGSYRIEIEGEDGRGETTVSVEK